MFAVILNHSSSCRNVTIAKILDDLTRGRLFVSGCAFRFAFATYHEHTPKWRSHAGERDLIINGRRLLGQQSKRASTFVKLPAVNDVDVATGKPSPSRTGGRSRAL